MDFSKFGEYGIAGLAVGLVAWMCWRLLQHVLDGRETDLAAHRAEVAAERASAREERQAFLAALEKGSVLSEKRHMECLQAHAESLQEIRGVREAVRDLAGLSHPLRHPRPKAERPETEDDS